MLLSGHVVIFALILLIKYCVWYVIRRVTPICGVVSIVLWYRPTQKTLQWIGFANFHSFGWTPYFWQCDQAVKGAKMAPIKF